MVAKLVLVVIVVILVVNISVVSGPMNVVLAIEANFAVVEMVVTVRIVI